MASSWISTVSIGLALLGFILFIHGLPRWLRGGSPRCSRCRYDLRESLHAEQCPECGADICRAGAVFCTTRRRPLFPLIIAGSMLILIGGVALPYISTMDIDWIRFRRTSSLVNEVSAWQRLVSVRGSTSVIVSSAETELLRRLERGKLDGGDIDAILRAAMPPKQTKDPSDAAGRDRCAKWAAVMAALFRRGRISQEDLLSFTRQSFGGAAVKVAWLYESGNDGRLLYQLSSNEPGGFVAFPLGYIWRISDVRIDGQPLRAQHSVRGHCQRCFHQPFVPFAHNVALHGIAPGEHRLTLVLEFSIVRHCDVTALFDSWRPGFATGDQDDSWFPLHLQRGQRWEDVTLPPALARWREEIAATFVAEHSPQHRPDDRRWPKR